MGGAGGGSEREALLPRPSLRLQQCDTTAGRPLCSSLGPAEVSRQWRLLSCGCPESCSRLAPCLRTCWLLLTTVPPRARPYLTGSAPPVCASRNRPLKWGETPPSLPPLALLQRSCDLGSLTEIRSHAFLQQCVQRRLSQKPRRKQKPPLSCGTEKRLTTGC